MVEINDNNNFVGVLECQLEKKSVRNNKAAVIIPVSYPHRVCNFVLSFRMTSVRLLAGSIRISAKPYRTT